MNPAAIPALRALRDCGVIRVTIGRVPQHYRVLQRDGGLRALRVDGDDTKADLRLNDAGKVMAAALPPIL